MRTQGRKLKTMIQIAVLTLVTCIVPALSFADIPKLPSIQEVKKVHDAQSFTKLLHSLGDVLNFHLNPGPVTTWDPYSSARQNIENERRTQLSAMKPYILAGINEAYQRYRGSHIEVKLKINHIEYDPNKKGVRFFIHKNKYSLSDFIWIPTNLLNWEIGLKHDVGPVFSVNNRQLVIDHKYEAHSSSKGGYRNTIYMPGWKAKKYDILRNHGFLLCLFKIAPDDDISLKLDVHDFKKGNKRWVQPEWSIEIGKPKLKLINCKWIVNHEIIWQY